MRMLGIDTATQTGSAAVVSDKGVISQYGLSIQATHSERLMIALDRVLKDAGIALTDVDGFAVSIGPGSFTGLRIGLSTVKGLAFATGKPVAAVPTLKALAWNVPLAAHPVCPLLDARKNEVYAALYRYEGSSLVQVMQETAISIPDLSKRISGDAIFTGEAALLRRSEILKLFGERALFAPLSAASPSAASVAEIGMDMILRGQQADPDALTPLYIRRPEAEVAWEKRKRSK